MITHFQLIHTEQFSIFLTKRGQSYDIETGQACEKRSVANLAGTKAAELRGFFQPKFLTVGSI